MPGWSPVGSPTGSGCGPRSTSPSSSPPTGTRSGCTRPAGPSGSESDASAARAYDILQNRLFTDPVLEGRYPDLSAFGVPGEVDCVRDGDLDLISAPIDALGVNYYMPTRLPALPDSPLPFWMEPVPGYPVTAFGWPVVPSALAEMLRLLRDRYGDAPRPVYVTENGCSSDNVLVDGAVEDQFRIGYLDGHLRALHSALADGVDVRGYFWWTLADNFEWSEGFSQRFGLVHVDHSTQERTPKVSFAWYRDLIAAQSAPL
jgi:beta-glucosidase